MDFIYRHGSSLCSQGLTHLLSNPARICVQIMEKHVIFNVQLSMNQVHTDVIILFFSKTSSVCWNSRHHVRTINVSLYVVTHKLNGNETTLKVKHHCFHVQLVGLWRRSQLDPLSLPSARSRAKGSGAASSALNDSCTSESETLNCIHLNI